MKNNDLLREYNFKEFVISTNKERIDAATVHAYLSKESYWARHIPLETVVASIQHSICIGAYTDTSMLVGFARLVTDRATFGYICDVFVLAPYRGKGISKAIMKLLCEMADEFKLRRFLLTTQDAHDLYRKSDFEIFPYPERMMTRKGVVYEAQ